MKTIEKNGKCKVEMNNKGQVRINRINPNINQDTHTEVELMFADLQRQGLEIFQQEGRF